MLQSIYTVLEGLGLSSQKRALHLRFSNEILNSQVLIQRIEGRHWINEGLHAELLCLSTHPYIALKQFIGCQVAVDQVTIKVSFSGLQVSLPQLNRGIAMVL